MLRKATPTDLFTLRIDVPFCVELGRSPRSSVICCGSLLSNTPRITAFITDSLFTGTGTLTPSRFVDFTRLADQDVQHDAVNHIVRAVKQNGFYFWSWLSVVYRPAFA